MEPKNIILIPARGGSTRVHSKNTRELNGKPLIVYAIETAIKSSCGRVVVSTNSKDIADIARLSGAEVPFLRPEDISTATSKSISVIHNALDWFTENEKWTPELVVFCPPTNPFRTKETIKSMIEKLQKNPNANSIVSITKPKTHPFRIVSEQKDGRLKNGIVNIKGKTINDIERSQDWPQVFEGSPACRITRSRYFIENKDSKNTKTYDVNNFIGFEIPEIEAFDIDTEEDFKLAEFYISKG